MEVLKLTLKMIEIINYYNFLFFSIDLALDNIIQKWDVIKQCTDMYSSQNEFLKAVNLTY